jgi:protein-S-isoprenylcysteine O-methyltransferase Ste14
VRGRGVTVLILVVAIPIVAIQVAAGVLHGMAGQTYQAIAPTVTAVVVAAIAAWAIRRYGKRATDEIDAPQD